MKQGIKRIYLLDEIRGIAILAMIVHHAFLDVGTVLGLDWGYEIFNFLCCFQPLFWTAFILISGICSQLSRNSVKRGAVVFAAAVLITFVTAVVMPKLNMMKSEIYFGILHCLGICMIVSGLLKKQIENTKNYIGFSILTVLFLATYSVSKGTLFSFIKLPDFLYETNILMPFGFFNSSFESADYFALFPWLFMFLIGSFIGKYAKNNKFPDFTYKVHSKFLCFVGKNALWFYLSHQVVLYAVFYAIQWIIIWYYS